MQEFTRRSLLQAVSASAVAASWGTVARAEEIDIAAAKREGRVDWYCSVPIEHAQKVAKLFETQTGIRIEMFRSGGTQVLSRFLQEKKAGRIVVDVLNNGDIASARALGQAGTFVPFKPKNFERIWAGARDPEGSFFGERLNMVTFFARSDKVPQKDRPRTWTDLLDPKYKGKLIMPDPSFSAFQVAVVGTIVRLHGWSYYEKLSKLDVMVARSNQQVVDMVKTGERLIAAGAADSYAVDAQRQGHPIANIFPDDGTFIIPNPVAVIKGGPHPNAAKLFAEFLVGDVAQREVVANGAYSSRLDIEPPRGSPPFKNINVVPIDFDALARDTPAIKKRFAEIFQ